MLQEKLEALRLKVNVVKSETVWRKKKMNQFTNEVIVKDSSIICIPNYYLLLHCNM